MRRNILSLLLAVSLLIIIGVASVSATGSNCSGDISIEADVPVELCTEYYDSCKWANEFPTDGGSHGWGDDVFILNWPGGGLSIHCYDRFLYGDFYSVYIIDRVGNTIVRFLCRTPEVETDSTHNGEGCPYGPHTGAGTVYSDGTCCVNLGPGTYEIRVRNELFRILMRESGRVPQCNWLDTHDDCGAWDPSGYYIHFSSCENPPVGGIWVSVDKFGLLAPYIGLVSTIVVATAVTAIYVKRINHRK